jgi:HK97 family phage major capsid protein
MDAVKIIETTTDMVKIAGWGLLFDGEDLEGEHFSAETDFELDLVPQKRVYYDHRIEEVKHPLGLVTRISLEGMGLWVEAQIDRSRKYAAEVIALIEEGLLGWSSGTAGHLADREGGMIKRWPILEFSLTPTPAEPRTLGVELIKHMAESNPLLEAALPRAAAKESAGASPQSFTTVENNMSKKTITQADLDAAKTGAAQEALQIAETDLQARVRQEVRSHLEDESALKEAGYLRAPAFNKTGLGDSEAKAFAHYVRSGDDGGIRGLKASNDTDMNVGTSADGGYAVPTGHFSGIIARRDEGMLAKRLGVRLIPGVGTTVNVPIDDEADGEFISTAEAASFDRDAPALNQKAMALVKYTKKVELSVELLQDEDSRLMAFLDDFIGRGMAKTHNNLLITEAAANGTSFKTFAATGAIAAGEPEDLVGNNDLGAYIEEDNSVGWVMRNATYWDIASITGNARLYASNLDEKGARTLLGYPVYMSQKVAAPAADAKSAYFGNWNYVGLREAPGFTFLRDPYSKASTGQVVLHYFFRTVYGVLQAEAIGYGAQASS